jgi:hypothetical protein
MGFNFINHKYMGGHTLVGRLSGISTQSGIVAASNARLGTLVKPAGKCGPCPVFASSYTTVFALQLRKTKVKPQSR